MNKWPVAEVFGPTIQGEGRQAGLPSYFIRFGGCDYRCEWCDTPHAVLPEQVRRLPRMSADEIVSEHLALLNPGPGWVVLTGGNPALHDLTELVNLLHDNALHVMVETQGTLFKPWLLDVDEVCVSPKPPSSLNQTPYQVTKAFLARFPSFPYKRPYLKVAVFDDDDYEWAKALFCHGFTKHLDKFLSVGNVDPSLPTVGNPHPQWTDEGPGGWRLEDTRGIVLSSYVRLADKVKNDWEMNNVRVLPQLHVLAWGNELGR